MHLFDELRAARPPPLIPHRMNDSGTAADFYCVLRASWGNDDELKCRLDGFAHCRTHFRADHDPPSMAAKFHEVVALETRDDVEVRVENHLPGRLSVVLHDVHAVAACGRLHRFAKARQLLQHIGSHIRRHVHHRRVAACLHAAGCAQTQAAAAERLAHVPWGQAASGRGSWGTRPGRQAHAQSRTACTQGSCPR